LILQLERLAEEGVEFLVIPRSGFRWHEENFQVGEYLRERHRLVTRQRHACEIWELEPGGDAEAGDEAVTAAVASGNGEVPATVHAPNAGRGTGVFRLLWNWRGSRSRDG